MKNVPALVYTILGSADLRVWTELGTLTNVLAPRSSLT